MEARQIRSKILVGLSIAAFTAALYPLAHLIFEVMARGLPVIARSPLDVLLREPPIPGSQEPGGVGPHILGSLVLTGLAALIGIPISLAAALYTVEASSRRLGYITSLTVRIMIEFPTVVIGLSVFGILTMIQQASDYLGLGIPVPRFSALSGSIALALVMIPFVYTQSEDALRMIPQHIREAVYSLGLSRTRASLVLTSYVRASILAAVMIGIAKILGETAPLLFTAFGSEFYTTKDPEFLLKPIGTLTLWIYKAGLSYERSWVDLAWAAAAILVIITLGIFILARIVARRLSP